MRKILRRISIPSLIGIVIVILLMAALVVSAVVMESTSKEKALRIAEDAIRRAAVTCYAIEGSYPDSYEYLAERYQVSVDPEKYIVYYNAFASNIMPEIGVFPIEKD